MNGDCQTRRVLVGALTTFLIPGQVRGQDPQPRPATLASEGLPTPRAGVLWSPAVPCHFPPTPGLAARGAPTRLSRGSEALRGRCRPLGRPGVGDMAGRLASGQGRPAQASPRPHRREMELRDFLRLRVPSLVPLLLRVRPSLELTNVKFLIRSLHPAKAPANTFPPPGRCGRLTARLRAGRGHPGSAGEPGVDPRMLLRKGGGGEAPHAHPPTPRGTAH